MKTKSKQDKTFDAVEFMRKKRDEISRQIEGLTPEQEIEFFKKGAQKLKKK